MPRSYSASALRKRRERAEAKGFVQPARHEEAAVSQALKHMRRSLLLHAQHDRISGKPHHHARLSTRAVADQIGPRKTCEALRAHKLAGKAKHLVGASVLAMGENLMDSSCVLSLDALVDKPCDLPLPGKGDLGSLPDDFGTEELNDHADAAFGDHSGNSQPSSFSGGRGMHVFVADGDGKNVAMDALDFDDDDSRFEGDCSCGSDVVDGLSKWWLSHEASCRRGFGIRDIGEPEVKDVSCSTDLSLDTRYGLQYVSDQFKAMEVQTDWSLSTQFHVHLLPQERVAGSLHRYCSKVVARSFLDGIYCRQLKFHDFSASCALVQEPVGDAVDTSMFITRDEVLCQFDEVRKGIDGHWQQQMEIVCQRVAALKKQLGIALEQLQTYRDFCTC
mmetsp:Transcript_68723/g.126222  ORF Transcript_68723/g.126222 Transcript_68723/m.126222 type:complete len:390 (+) Transcript_68723:127-1296(+)